MYDIILKKLDEISRSNFTQTPHDSFHTMQSHWKVEIEEKVDEIRMKESVSTSHKCYVVGKSKSHALLTFFTFLILWVVNRF